MHFQKMTAILATAAMACCVLPSLAAAQTTAASEMRDISTAVIVREMGVGINLGNTYESCGEWIAEWGDGSVESYVTAWGSPVITQEIIQGYANVGFGVLRIPVAWSNLMGEDYTISSEYLSAVQQAVDWTLSSGMYAIVNIHYDGGWFANFPTETAECMAKYTRIWEQLAAAFANYGDHLMLESLNEEGCWNDVWNPWGGDDSTKKTAFDLLNNMNQTFVDIIRGSGCNNAKRHLLIAGYGTDIEKTCDSLFQMPNDPIGRCAVSVHYYTPTSFAILEEDADWAEMRPTWGTDADLQELSANLDKMKEAFTDKGIPVILGEFGCPKTNKAPESVFKYLTTVCREAYDREMCPVLWDTTGQHYDRDACEMVDKALAQEFFLIRSGGRQRGDVNYDRSLTGADVVALNKVLIGRLQVLQKDGAFLDMNADGVVNGFDTALLKQTILMKNTAA